MIKFKQPARSSYLIALRSFPHWLKRKPLVMAAVVAGLGYWLFFVGGSGKDHKKQDIPVTIAKAVQKEVPVYLDTLGTVQAYNTVTLHSQIDGRLESVLFQEGQDVHVGDVLAKIDPRTYQAQYDQAMANKDKDQALLDNANRDLNRYQTLGKSVSDQTRDTQHSTVHQLEAVVAADQAAVENAKALLSYTVISAPIDGRTGIRQVDAGNIVRAGDANGLVVLTQLQPISVVFSLPQQNLPVINEQINAGKILKVMAMDADNREAVDNGTLDLVDNQIDQNTGTIRLKSTFPNAKRSLGPGGFVNVRLLVTVREHAVVIPASAVQRGPKNTYVFLYKAEDGTVSIKPVKVAMIQDQDAVIDEGIAEGDQVVTDGIAKLQEGSHVSLPEVKSDETKDVPKAGSKEEEKKSKPHPKKG